MVLYINIYMYIYVYTIHMYGTYVYILYGTYSTLISLQDIESYNS